MSEMLKILNKLKLINDNLCSLQKEFNKCCDNVLNFDLNDNSIIDCMKVCRSDLKVIDSNQKCEYFKCFWPKCQFKTKHEISLERHQLIHKNEKQFKCNECHKEFRQLRGLLLHKWIHTNVKSFKCNECNKLFKSKYGLEIHHLIHKNQKRFACDWSGSAKRFNSKSNLWSHRRYVHLKEKKFICDYNDCQKSCLNRSDLNKHKRLHSGDKPFVCIDCGKRFGQKSGLNQHIISVHSKDTKHNSSQINECSE